MSDPQESKYALFQIASKLASTIAKFKYGLFQALQSVLVQVLPEH
jgi:hypothetical protein